MPDITWKLRNRQPLLGYWVASDSIAIAERVAAESPDYVCFDMQHGLMEDRTCMLGLTAVDAMNCPGLVRVIHNDAHSIGRALDLGARGVIVPMIDTVADAEAAVGACRYPPKGVRSFGPSRSGLRIGPEPVVADQSVACLVMIETYAGLSVVEEICATPGLDGIYIGPNDLALALRAAAADGNLDPGVFAAAKQRIRLAAEHAGISVGIHCNSGREAAAALCEGFTFASISCDLDHLSDAVREHLADARAGGSLRTGSDPT